MSTQRGRITLYNRWRRFRGKSFTTYGHEQMPDKFDELAVYNAERYRGIVHTDEHDQRMAVLQDEFNEWAARRG